MAQDVHKDNADDMKKVARGAGVTFAGSFIGRGLWFLSQVVVARFFGADVFGLYILGLMVLKISELLSRLGLHNGAMRFVSVYRKEHPEKVKGVLLSSAAFSFAVGTVMCALLYAFSGPIATGIFRNQELGAVIRWFALCVPFMSTMMVLATASQGFHTARYLVWSKDIVQPAVNMALIAASIFLGLGIYGVCAAFVVSCAAAMAASIYFLTVQFPMLTDRGVRPSFNSRELMAYSVPLLLNGFLIFLINWTDALMLGVLHTSSSVGIYRAASQVPMFLGMILMAFNSIYAPAIAEMHHEGALGRMEVLFKATARWVFLFSLPLSVLLIFSATAVMALFGQDFTAGRGPSVLVVLALAQLVNCTTGSVGFTLNMTGRQKVEMTNSIVLVCVNAVLNYLLIPAYGSLGAAIATAISLGAINLLRLLEVFLYYRMHPFGRTHLGLAAAGAGSAVVLFLIRGAISGYPYIAGVAVNAAVVGVVFVAVFFLMGLSGSDRLIMDAIARKLHIRASRA